MRIFLFTNYHDSLLGGIFNKIMNISGINWCALRQLVSLKNYMALFAFCERLKMNMLFSRAQRRRERRVKALVYEVRNGNSVWRCNS